MAVTSVLLGLASVVALAHPAAWLVPLLAVLVGAWGLRRIMRHPDSLQGLPLAALGMTLGMFFLTWAPTTYFADRWIVQRQARDFGQEWIEAVLNGETEKAHQATLPVRERQPRGTSLADYYATHDLQRAERDAYFHDGMAQQLADLPGNAHCVYQENIGLTDKLTYTVTSPRYLIYRNGQSQPSLHLQLEVIREEDKDGVYWTVIRVSDADVADERLRSRQNR